MARLDDEELSPTCLVHVADATWRTSVAGEPLISVIVKLLLLWAVPFTNSVLQSPGRPFRSCRDRCGCIGQKPSNQGIFRWLVCIWRMTYVSSIIASPCPGSDFNGISPADFRFRALAQLLGSVTRVHLFALKTKWCSRGVMYFTWSRADRDQRQPINRNTGTYQRPRIAIVLPASVEETKIPRTSGSVSHVATCGKVTSRYTNIIELQRFVLVKTALAKAPPPGWCGNPTGGIKFLKNNQPTVEWRQAPGAYIL